MLRLTKEGLKIMAKLIFYPEMQEKKPKADGQASLSHYGKHYFVDTFLELNGRGIEFLGRYASKDLTQYAQHKIGMNKYKITLKAFNKLCQQYDFSSELLLD